MPAKIDRIGRAHEWLTSARLNELAGNLAAAARDEHQAEEYASTLDSSSRKRVTIAAEKSAAWIARAHKGKIIESKVIGEASKRPGGPDFDLAISIEGGDRVGYSLKVQTSSSGVNLRNPTLDSFLRGVCGRQFRELLTGEQWCYYVAQGESYSRGQLESKRIGRWAIPFVAKGLLEAYRAQPDEFVSRLLGEMRAGTNLLLTVVTGDGRFLGYVTRFGRVVSKLKEDPRQLTIVGNGISIFFGVGDEPLCHLDLYMLSYSGGKGNRLRGAVRADFCLDPPS